MERLQRSYGISAYQAGVLCSDPPAIRFFDEAMTHAPSEHGKEFAKAVGNLLCNELFALVKEQAAAIGENDDDASVAHSTVSAHQLGELARLQQEGKVSSTMAKKILAIMFETADHGASPRQVAVEHGFELITDHARLMEVCRQVITEYPEELEVYRKGGKFVSKMQKLFTGKAMAACRGNAHPERLQEAVEQALEDADSSRR